MVSCEYTIPVSVVVPCFRCATTINRAVESIAHQTMKPVEVILVDDASGDDTLAALQELAESCQGWVRVLQLSENRGAAHARNVGWEAATQPHLAFLDADDTWHPEKLRIQYEYMRSNPEIAISGHQCIWLRDGETLPKIPEKLNMTKIRAICLVFRNSFSTPSVMLKRDIPLRFDDNKRYAEDIYLWQQAAFAGLRIMRIETPLAYVHKALYGGGGLSGQLCKMEKGELSNFVALYQAGCINWLLFVIATGFSITKYVKRLTIIYAKKWIAFLPLP